MIRPSCSSKRGTETESIVQRNIIIGWISGWPNLRMSTKKKIFFFFNHPDASKNKNDVWTPEKDAG